MALRVVGAGLPRTGTTSLREALKQLLGSGCYHMSTIPGHPYDLGADWDLALSGGTPDWRGMFDGCAAAVDWPASAFWREIGAAHPDAVLVLSVRDSAQVWWESMDATVLPAARAELAADWSAGHDLSRLFERFTGTPRWDDPALLCRAYDAHLADVRATAPAGRLVEWRAQDGWAPLCAALDVPVPQEPFPWHNRRSEWG